MPRTYAPLAAALLAALALATLPGNALGRGASPAEPPAAHQPRPEQSPQAHAEPTPMHMDHELAREHELFTSFAQQQVHRMNANIIGGRHSMRVHKGHDGLFRASYKAIDTAGVVCQVRRAEHDPHYFVGVIIYKELVLESRGQTAEACRNGSFEPVGQTAHRLIYSSRRGGGWH